MEFFFYHPYELPSMVNHARVIDTDGYLYTFNTLDPTSRDSESVDKWTDVTFGGSVNFNKVKTPQYIVFCWDSYIDQQTYETSAVFGPETRQRMKTPADHTRPSGAPVWYNRMVFGLSPGGKVKIWFSDVAGRPSLPVTPLKLTTRSGKDLTSVKTTSSRAAVLPSSGQRRHLSTVKPTPYGNWD